MPEGQPVPRPGEAQAGFRRAAGRLGCGRTCRFATDLLAQATDEAIAAACLAFQRINLANIDTAAAHVENVLAWRAPRPVIEMLPFTLASESASIRQARHDNDQFRLVDWVVRAGANRKGSKPEPTFRSTERRGFLGPARNHRPFRSTTIRPIACVRG